MLIKVKRYNKQKDLNSTALIKKQNKLFGQDINYPLV